MCMHGLKNKGLVLVSSSSTDEMIINAGEQQALIVLMQIIRQDCLGLIKIESHTGQTQELVSGAGWRGKTRPRHTRTHRLGTARGRRETVLTG